MAAHFQAGDNLVFQVESGFGLIRVLAAEDIGGEITWHLLVYEDFFPDIDQAEAALQEPDKLHVGNPHMALTDRAFERTPASLLNNRAVTPSELNGYEEWSETGERKVSDRSVLQMLGMR